ncbi:hypothetical protein BACFIN_08381 [Bacteroides finegoldii DSM 17565]|nr:hypothetical protein BACFIN_08381 [Bacteroides finegoldii DSM 17565]
MVSKEKLWNWKHSVDLKRTSNNIIQIQYGEKLHSFHYRSSYA